MLTFDHMKNALIVLVSLVVSCASKPESKPVEVVVHAPVQVPASTETPAAPAAVPQVSVPAMPVGGMAPNVPAESRTQAFKVKNGRIQNGQPSPILLSQTKNKKTPGVTTEKCWNYKKFAVVEMKSTDEIGAAEIGLRIADEQHKSLCGKEFKGTSKDLKIIEGHFAGAAGDFVLIEGEDGSEGLLEFQIFNAEGKELYKSAHHPREEFLISVKDGKAALTFFAKANVKCELAADKEPCWKKVLEQNQIPHTPMPDCQGVFAKAKLALTEPALVTVRAAVADVNNPKLKFLGGKSTCAPAP